MFSFKIPLQTHIKIVGMHHVVHPIRVVLVVAVLNIITFMLELQIGWSGGTNMLSTPPLLFHF